MKPKLILCLALVLVGLLTSCVMQREFRGSTVNLKGDGGQTSITNDLKMTVADSGITTNGGNYMVLSLPDQHCQLVLFYPKMKPNYFLRANLATNGIHVWQQEYGRLSTNGIREDLSRKQMDVWLARGKQLNRSQLELGPEGVLPANAEKLYGQIEMVKDGGEFHINVNLSDEKGMKLSGIFDSYKEPWPPLIVPYIFFGGDSD